MNEQEPTSTERKPYSEPQLVEYGDLDVLTQTPGIDSWDENAPTKS